MINYEKQNFVKGQVLKAGHLNHMEDGISSCEDKIKDYENKIDERVDDLSSTLFIEETTPPLIQILLLPTVQKCR